MKYERTRIVRFMLGINKLDIVRGPGSTEVAQTAIMLLNGQNFVPMRFTVIDPQNVDLTMGIRLFCERIEILHGSQFVHSFVGKMNEQTVRANFAFHVQRSMNPCGEIVLRTFSEVFKEGGKPEDLLIKSRMQPSDPEDPNYPYYPDDPGHKM